MRPVDAHDQIARSARAYRRRLRETILPYWSEDETIMEEALLYAPILQFGTLFLEENQQDGLLDLIYRLGFPLYPPALTGRLLDRLFAIAAYELGEIFRFLAENPEGT